MPADPAITAAACRYLLVALLTRLEDVRPGLVGLPPAATFQSKAPGTRASHD